MAATPSWLKRMVFLLGIAAVLFVFLWYEYQILFPVFAGFLLAIVLQTCAAWIEGHTRLNRKFSYTVTVLLLSGVIALMALLIAPQTIQETGEIAAIVPKALHQAQIYLDQRPWGRYVVQTAHQAMNGSQTSANIENFALRLVHGTEGLAIILIVGFFGALDPAGYGRALLRLLPVEDRQKSRKVGLDVIYTLRWWLLGQLVPMVFLGVFTMGGLWLLHVPLAFTLGLFTGLMIFIPYVGAILVAIPAILVGLTVSTKTALYALILYCVVHAVEGYVLTPWVQKKAIRLPPLLTILSQLFMWSMAGLTGVLVATPLAAAVLVLIKVLYLHEQLPSRFRAPSPPSF